MLERGRGSGTQKFVYQKWHDRIFPIVNFVSSHDGHFGLEGGEGRALLEGEGGHRGSPRAVAERSQGMCKRLGEAVSGGWKCGWGWCWGMGMPLG